VHDHKQAYDQALGRKNETKSSACPRYNVQVPMDFDRQCDTCQRIETSSVRLRVPSVLFFLGSEGPQSDSLISGLEFCHNEFGVRNIQLLVFANEKPSLLSQRLNLTVPIMGDNGLGALYLGQPSTDRSHAAVIVGNDGQALCVLRKFPCNHPAQPILGQVDRLRARFPGLFSWEKKLAHLIPQPTF
jgi:hypothetical protein